MNRTPPIVLYFLMLTAAGLSAPVNLIAQKSRPAKEITDCLTFYASFDGDVEADLAKGDPRLYTIMTARPHEVIKAGLHAGGMIALLQGGGRSGDALKFTKKQANRIFFKARRNLAYQTDNWQGCVSLWLRLDPEKDLEPGYCDPIQITPRKWNDAAFFVDFDKEGDPRDFRLGVFADYSIWNPEDKPLGQIPESKRPLLPVEDPPFDENKWTHIAFSWKNFNTQSKSGVASFYLDGQLQGRVTGWDQQFTWKSDEECRIQIGLNYIGLFDELACFDRALSQREIKQLYQFHGNLISVRKPAR